VSRQVETLLRQTSAAVAVEGTFARQQPDTVRQLARAGVPILVTEPARGPVFDEIRDIPADAAGITALTGSRPTLFVPTRHVDAVDLGVVTTLHDRVVQPRVLVDGRRPVTIAGSEIVLVDCSRDDTCDLARILAAVAREAARRQVPLGSITELERTDR
jgi:hypothetical protein